MLKKDEVVGIAKKVGEFASKAETERKLKEVEELLTGIISEIPVGEKAKVAGLTIEKKVVEAHTARNPKNGESVEVPEKIKTTIKLK